MHPLISSFPSRMFYNSRLTDDPSLETSRGTKWHQGLFKPFSFLDVFMGRESKANNSSTYNDEEIEVCVKLVGQLLQEFHYIDVFIVNKFKGKIGIISFYKEQVKRLRQKFSREFGKNSSTFFDINTVDGFQGQEKDIIILSCVRASNKFNSQHNQIGFLADKRRINVALTRARYSLLVLGNHNTLAKDELWSDLVLAADEIRLSTKISSNDPMLAKNKQRITV